MPRPGRLDYGWAVVAGLCVTETVSWGIIYYGFPVMLRPMEAELGFSRAEITGAFSAGLAVAALASTIFMPIEAWLLVRFGWRQSLLMLAAVLAVITIPIHALVLRRPPHAARPRDGAITHDDRPGVTLSVASRTAVFWVLAAAFFAGNFTTNSATVHFIPYLSEHGYSPTVAAVTIGWMGAMQVPARIFFAPVAARFGHGGVTAAIFFMQAARSEEHTSELQSRLHLVCRLLLEKKKRVKPVDAS